MKSSTKLPLKPVRLLGIALVLGACSESAVVLDNGTVSQWDTMRGRWVLVNYWAEWCAPCRREIPELNEIHHDSSETNVYVLGVNFDGIEGDALEALKEEMGIAFPQLGADPSPRWGQSAPTILPTTYVIDPNGQLARVLVGPQTIESLMAAVEAANPGP